jgi:hypothetical protein
MEPPPLSNVSVARHPEKSSVATGTNGCTDSATVTGSGAGTVTNTAAAGDTLNIRGSVSVTGPVTIVGTIESDFLNKFRVKFGVPGQTPRPWPSNDILSKPDKMVEEFKDVLHALFICRETFADPPTGGTAGSAKKLIEDLIKDNEWPHKFEKAPVPAPWKTDKERDLFRRYEVSAAMDILMRAYDAAGAGGGSTPFPPDH